MENIGQMLLINTEKTKINIIFMNASYIKIKDNIWSYADDRAKIVKEIKK